MSTMSRARAADIAAVRRFNRLYTQHIGVLHEGLLDSSYSLAEVRVMYELAHRASPTAAELSAALAIDPGYLSRILAGFTRQRLVTRSRAPDDARRTHLALTARGRDVFTALDRRSDAQVAAMLASASPVAGRAMVSGMRLIEAALAPEPAPPAPAAITLREPRPGDLGWIVHRHGVLYADEYGWDARFEGLVAGVVADFAAHHDPARERAWIAERDGEIVGSIFLVAKSRTVARLRLLLVEPSARGTGLGTTLVTECVAFARRAGYRTITLWTNAVLHAARRLYQRAGFRLVGEEAHELFGPSQRGQTWELSLRGPAT
jgi:DNA-binding MarR family transcriptional regulator/GNAT superfamily N-acetyltransferase